ncbi:hypothetical protein [Nocardiopsis alborubida]|uniref:hypothetical protein n=1 Tax=Nocardiopsis alborubida TaxID=146802 RepID=UPI000A7EB7D0|nr:hypothetical protein [Nocardiopsis alborubida]
MDILRGNNVTVTGAADGPTVVLARGSGCDQDMWRLLVPPPGRAVPDAAVRLRRLRRGGRLRPE